jgi:hypothetical protein
MQYRLIKLKHTYVISLIDESGKYIFTPYYENSLKLFRIIRKYININHYNELNYEFELKNVNTEKLVEMLNSEDEIIVKMIMDIIINSKI